MSIQASRPTNDDGPLAAVDLYWIPLGAGQRVVRLSGRLFEAISARLQRRRSCDLYHSALVVVVPPGRFVIEQAPIPDDLGGRRGVVFEGAVGTKHAERFRHFRYEVRRWRGGVIPDIATAVSSPIRVTEDLALASRILDLVPCLPALVWGRDELHTGEMWNSNSVTSWLLASAGVDATRIQPPHRGRAPGWRSGLVLAARDAVQLSSEPLAEALPEIPSRVDRPEGDRASRGPSPACVRSSHAHPTAEEEPWR